MKCLYIGMMYKVDREQKAMMALENLEFYDNKEIEDDMKNIAMNNEKQAEQFKKAIEDIKQEDLNNEDQETISEGEDQNIGNLDPVLSDRSLNNNPDQIENIPEPNSIQQPIANPSESLVTPVKHNIESVQEEELEESPYQNNAQDIIPSPNTNISPGQMASKEAVAEEYQTNLQDQHSQKSIEGEYEDDDDDGEQDDNSE